MASGVAPHFGPAATYHGTSKFNPWGFSMNNQHSDQLGIQWELGSVLVACPLSDLKAHRKTQRGAAHLPNPFAKASSISSLGE